jgi:hypothetical protein
LGVAVDPARAGLRGELFGVARAEPALRLEPAPRAAARLGVERWGRVRGRLASTPWSLLLFCDAPSLASGSAIAT